MTFYSPKYYKEQRKSAALDRMDKPLYQINKSEDEVITVAKNNWELDVIGNINEGYKAWLDAGNEGSRQNYLDSLSIEELKTLSYKKGGSVGTSNKPKEPSSVKKIDLTQELLKTADTLSKLTDSERETINWMLTRISGKK